MKTAKELFSLDGKIAIVTGGRGLYGASISEGLCEMGATVVIASRSGDKCEEFAQTLRGKGYSAIGLSLDLSDDASIKALAKDVHDRYGRIDILVNNAVDRRNMTPLAAATRQKLQDSASTNLNGQILLSQAVLEYMVPQESGSIINISSMRGLDSPHFPFYPPAMGDHRVNCIAPGGFNPGLSDDPERKSFVDTYIANCPLGCWANEDDIKGPIVFLASEAANYVTGATIVMDGGWTIW